MFTFTPTRRVDEATEALIATDARVRAAFQGPDMRESLRGPAPVDGWQPIVDKRCENTLVREGLVRRPGEAVCPRCFTVITPAGTCMC